MAPGVYYFGGHFVRVPSESTRSHLRFAPPQPHFGTYPVVFKEPA